MQSKRIIISTFGSFGDVHPYVGIGLELKARGHQPVIATSEIYREKMKTAGLEFYPVRPDMPSIDEPDEVARIVGEVMDAKRGPEAVGNLIIPHLRDIYVFSILILVLLLRPSGILGTAVAEKV